MSWLGRHCALCVNRQSVIIIPSALIYLNVSQYFTFYTDKYISKKPRHSLNFDSTYLYLIKKTVAILYKNILNHLVSLLVTKRNYFVFRHPKENKTSLAEKTSKKGKFSATRHVVWHRRHYLRALLSSRRFLNMEQTPRANSQTLIYFLLHFLVFRFRVNFKCGTRALR